MFEPEKEDGWAKLIRRLRKLIASDLLDPDAEREAQKRLRGIVRARNSGKKSDQREAIAHLALFFLRKPH